MKKIGECNRTGALRGWDDVK